MLQRTLSHFLPAWDLYANSSHLPFPTPMTQELGLTLSLIPYSSISDYENTATHADSMDEVRGDGKKHIGSLSLMYPPSIVSQQQETKLTAASAIKEIYWLVPLRGSSMAAFRSQIDFITNLSLLHVLALPPSLLTSCLGRLNSW